MQGAFPPPHASRHDLNRIDLGDEPPLLTGENRHGPPDRKRVNFRWLAGTVLTGLTSMTLMGGALFAALEGQHTLARTPKPDDIADLALASRSVDASIGKSDKIVRKQIRAPARRNVIQVSTVRKVGDKNLIRKRPFVLVSSPLYNHVNDLIADVPEFNPIRIFSSETEAPERSSSGDAIYEADVDGDVAISRSAFPFGAHFAQPDTVLTESAIIASIQLRSLDAAAQVEGMAYAGPDQDRFDFDKTKLPSDEDIAVRIVPENMSIIERRQANTSSTRGYDEEVVPVLKPETVTAVLQARGVNDTVSQAVASSFEENFGIKELDQGQQLRIAYERPEFSEDESLVIRVSLYADAKHQATVAFADAGIFVAANPPEDLQEALFDEMESAISIAKAGPAPTIYESIYQTAYENDVPRELVEELIRIFTFDLDFRGRVKPGDMVELFFGLDHKDQDDHSAPEILYAAIEQNGLKRQYYRYTSRDDDSVGFFDETGKSAKKFLMRKPLSGGKFRSGFGVRRHPILGYRKMHAGVDWSAPKGTPIMAAGNGVIREAKWRSGYGKWILIQHSNGYATGYAHQSRFARGIQAGQRVRQGQVIGYIGTTGLSTGPHLHYEVLVNDHNVNPMRIRLPQGRVLKADAEAEFERERDRIDSLIERARNSNMIASQ